MNVSVLLLPLKSVAEGTLALPPWWYSMFFRTLLTHVIEEMSTEIPYRDLCYLNPVVHRASAEK